MTSENQDKHEKDKSAETPILVEAGRKSSIEEIVLFPGSLADLNSRNKNRQYRLADRDFIMLNGCNRNNLYNFRMGVHMKGYDGVTDLHIVEIEPLEGVPGAHFYGYGSPILIKETGKFKKIINRIKSLGVKDAYLQLKKDLGRRKNENTINI